MTHTLDTPERVNMFMLAGYGPYGPWPLPMGRGKPLGRLGALNPRREKNYGYLWMEFTTWLQKAAGRIDGEKG